MGEKGDSSSGVKEIKEEAMVTDTPDRSKSTQINAPITKFEDSPVFNFLNSLSPIRPVRSAHNTQAFNSLTFASLPSVFTSPHVSSLKGSRFLRRHQLGDPSDPEFSSDNLNKDDTTEGISYAAPRSTENQENFNPVGCAEAPTEPNECTKLAVDLVRSLNYDFGSPNPSQAPSGGLKTKLMPEMAGSSGALIPYVQEECIKMFHGTEANTERVSQIEQNKDAAGCDWEGLISDTTDLLVFESPNDTEAFKKSMNTGTRFYASVSNDEQNSQAFVAVDSIDQLGQGSELENQFTQPGDGNELEEFYETQETAGVSCHDINCTAGGPADPVDPETVSNLYRGIRRRCLVFELSGASRKHLNESSTSDTAMLPLTDGSNIPSEKQALSAKPGKESSRCVFPGIGLHLNALATTSKDYNVVKNGSFTSGRPLLISPGSACNHHLLDPGQDSVSRPVDVTQSDREVAPAEIEAPVSDDGGQASAHMVNEESIQSSPKKKRRRVDSGEVEGCKRCNCKRSKCLKLYCECFAAGVYCVEPCSCIECFNKPIHEDTVLATRKQIESRNPLAFAPKVIRTSDSLTETGDDSSKTPASARHKRGCNCKKSGCLKKYCECYQGGVGCSINCRCEGCKNAFGRKDGSEGDMEEKEAALSRKSVMHRSQQGSLIQGDAEQNPDYVPPATPLSFARPSVPFTFPSNNKPPRSAFFPAGSSSTMYGGQAFGKPNFLLHPSKFDNNFGKVQEDEVPEILQTNGSPISSIKSGSPNSKRVSPPHSGRGSGMLLGQRSSRKLILQSIPSFPSLTPK